MAARKTIGQKRQERQQQAAAAPAPAGRTQIDLLVSKINQRLGGIGHVYTGADVKQRVYERRSTGIPSLDYILCGGYPRGGLVEFGGEYSTGKTSIALEGCATVQRTTGGNIGWVALEPFSKRWARERGFWLPFSETEIEDPVSGELRPVDPFAQATKLELYRMEQAGITDPYEERGRFVLVQEERGDVALDAALDMIKSNLFEIVVVDSLGVAKSTKWLEESEVQDAGDFPREAKMIGDYTTRAMLALNKRYDVNNVEAKDGQNVNETTVIHLNHITTVVNTQARAKHKTQSIKGGEGNKHNHHAIIFLWKGETRMVEGKGNTPPYRYAQEVRCMCLKSKLGPPMMEGGFDFYIQPFGPFQTGDYDIAKDAIELGEMQGLITRSGAWYEYEDLKAQGREAMATLLRENPEWLSYLLGQLQQKARRT